MREATTDQLEEILNTMALSISQKQRSHPWLKDWIKASDGVSELRDESTSHMHEPIQMRRAVFYAIFEMGASVGLACAESLELNELLTSDD